MPGAVIRPNTIIGDKCSVGHGSEVKHCVMMNGSKVASLAFAGDSVLGKSARIGSGVITANRKFNQSNATVKIDGQKHDLGTDFFGCILGDCARLGANSVTQPGTHIGPYTWVYPMTNVRGFIPREKRVFQERETVMEQNEVVELK
jgi:bifunctional UDP-N-acetylglucosamine pyrophosphorylase/glucosamine-1-phosphate N-acetyltransferase